MILGQKRRIRRGKRMATKGQSYQYGNSRGTPTKHINYKYAKDFNS